MSKYKKEIDEFKKELTEKENENTIDNKEEEISNKKQSNDKFLVINEDIVKNKDTIEEKDEKVENVEESKVDEVKEVLNQETKEHNKKDKKSEENAIEKKNQAKEKEKVEDTSTDSSTTIDNTIDEVRETIQKDNEDRKKELQQEVEEEESDFISFKNVSKNYMSDSYSVQTLALDDVSFNIKEGELVIMLGHSGAGKTTTLNLLGGMDTATSGRIIVGDKEISNYSLDQLTEYRKNDIGFIFQSYNLIQNLTVKENIDLATEIKNEKVDASIILDKVGIADKINAFPVQLSGGEQQRVAIARAIAKKPKILLCDEPTGSLDDVTGKQILALIQKTCIAEKVTTIIITHNLQLSDMANKVICFNSGKVTKIITNENPKNVEDLEW